MNYLIGDIENDDSGHLSEQIAIGVFHKEVMKGQLLILRTGSGHLGSDYCEDAID